MAGQTRRAQLARRAFCGLAAVVISFVLDRYGLFGALFPAAVREMGIGSIVPGVAAGALAFGVGLLARRAARA